jgi:hypothetical protein
MAGPKKTEKRDPGDPLEVVIQPMLEVPSRGIFYKRKVGVYKLGLKAFARMQKAGINPELAARAFLGTPRYWQLRRRVRQDAGYRDDGSGKFIYLPAGHRERVQANENELIDAFWSGWNGWGMLDRGGRIVNAKYDGRWRMTIGDL